MMSSCGRSFRLWCTLCLLGMAVMEARASTDINPGRMSGYHFNSDPHSGTFSYGFMVHRADPIDRALSRTGGLQRRTTDPITSYGTQHERKADGHHNWGFFIADEGLRRPLEDLTDRSGRENKGGVDQVRTQVNYGAGKQPIVFKVSPRPGPPIPEIVSTARPPGFLRPRPTSQSFPGSNSRPGFNSNVGPSGERPHHHHSNSKPVIAHVTIDTSKKRPIVIQVNPSKKEKLPIITSTGSIKPPKRRPGAIPGIIVRDNPPPGPPFPEVVTDRPVRRPPNGGLREVYRPKPPGVFFVQGRVSAETDSAETAKESGLSDLQVASSGERHIAMQRDDFSGATNGQSINRAFEIIKDTTVIDTTKRNPRARNGRNLFSQRHGRLLEDISVNKINIDELAKNEELPHATAASNRKNNFRGRIRFSDTSKQSNIIKLHLPEHADEQLKSQADSTVTLLQSNDKFPRETLPPAESSNQRAVTATRHPSELKWHQTLPWKPQRRTFLNVHSSQRAPFETRQTFTNRDIIRPSFDALTSTKFRGRNHLEYTIGVTEEPVITTYRPAKNIMDQLLKNNERKNPAHIPDTIRHASESDKTPAEHDESEVDNESEKEIDFELSHDKAVEATTYRPHSPDSISQHDNDQIIQHSTNRPVTTIRHNQAKHIQPFRGTARFENAHRFNQKFPLFGKPRPFSRTPVTFPARSPPTHSSTTEAASTATAEHVKRDPGTLIVTARPFHRNTVNITPSTRLIPPTVEHDISATHVNREEQREDNIDPHLQAEGIVITHNGQRSDRKPDVLESGSERFRSHMHNIKTGSTSTTTVSSTVSSATSNHAPISEQHLDIEGIHVHSVTIHPIMKNKDGTRSKLSSVFPMSSSPITIPAPSTRFTPRTTAIPSASVYRSSTVSEVASVLPITELTTTTSIPKTTATTTRKSVWRPTISGKLNWNSRPQRPPVTDIPFTVISTRRQSTTRDEPSAAPTEISYTDTLNLLPAISSTPLPVITTTTQPSTTTSTWQPSISGEVRYYDPLKNSKQRLKTKDSTGLARLGGHREASIDTDTSLLSQSDAVKTSSAAGPVAHLPSLCLLLYTSLYFVL